MNDDPIREYLSELASELGRFALHRRRTLAEVEDHLREAAARIEHSGVSPDEAARQAIEQFGSPQVVSRQSAAASRASRRYVAVAVGVCVVVAAVAVMQPWSGSSHTAAPPAPSTPSGHVSAAGVVTGRLIKGGSVLASFNRPVPYRAFEISSVTGDVFRITTDARGEFRFHGRPGTYYPSISKFGSSADLKSFRIAAGQTTHVVLNSDPSTWRAMEVSLDGVRVPGVAPIYVQDAESTIQSVGLRVEIASVPGVSAVDAGVNGYAVLGQSPRAGTRVPAGTVVVLRLAVSVNAGPGGVGKPGTVPNLIGLPVNRAIEAATSAGLHVTVPAVRHPVASDSVTAQSIPSGSRVKADSIITLTLG